MFMQTRLIKLSDSSFREKDIKVGGRFVGKKHLSFQERGKEMRTGEGGVKMVKIHYILVLKTVNEKILKGICI